MPGFQPFGGATKFFAAITMAAGLIIQGVLNLNSATITGNQVPTTNNTYNLGTPTSTWHETYTNGLIFSNATGTNTTSTSLAVTGIATSTFAGTVSSTKFNADASFCIGNNSQQCIDSVNAGQLRYTGTVRADGLLFPLSGISSIGGDVTPGSTSLRNLGSASLFWLTTFSTNVTTTNVTTTNLALNGPNLFMPALGALTATGDFLCQNNSSPSGTVQVQLANCTVSSIWFKKNVASLPIKELHEKVLKLRSVEYDMRATGDHEIGFIAEEVARVEPSLVVFEESNDPVRIAYIKTRYPDVVLQKDGKILLPKTVDYMRMSVLFAASEQYLSKRVDSLYQQMYLFQQILNLQRFIKDIENSKSH